MRNLRDTVKMGWGCGGGSRSKTARFTCLNFSTAVGSAPSCSCCLQGELPLHCKRPEGRWPKSESIRDSCRVGRCSGRIAAEIPIEGVENGDDVLRSTTTPWLVSVNQGMVGFGRGLSADGHVLRTTFDANGGQDCAAEVASRRPAVWMANNMPLHPGRPFRLLHRPTVSKVPARLIGQPRPNT